MSDFLKDHPFAVEAFFKSSVVLTYALPKEKLQPLIPECLELDTFGDTWAFIAVAMVQTTELRPKGFPKFMGNDFFLIGYRVFVRYRAKDGKRLRGLYILRSQTDRKKMQVFGNLFTHYNYTTTDIRQSTQGSVFEIASAGSALQVRFEKGDEQIPLPAGSPFADWKEARRFAGPLPFTFTYNRAKKEVLIIEGVRENWTPKPVLVTHQSIGFLKELGLNGDAILANAFIITDIPYLWKKGRKELWKP
jgi:uncharacterized protein YqjF (DUF2071 family)